MTSLVIYNRKFEQSSIPRGIENQLSSYPTRIDDIPIILFMDAVSNVFECKIHTLCNRTHFRDLKFVLLGEAHISKLHRIINTLIVRLFARDGDYVCSEDDEFEKGTKMIELQEVHRKLNFWHWDSYGATDEFKNYISYFIYVTQSAGTMGQQLINMFQRYNEDSLTFNEKINEINNKLMEIRNQILAVQEFVVPEFIKEAMAEENTNCTDLARIYKHSANTLSLIIVYVADGILNKTFKFRQESLAEDLSQMSHWKERFFFLAGSNHFLDANLNIEETIKPDLLKYGKGYLIVEAQDIQLDEPEGFIQVAEENYPDYNFERSQNLAVMTVLVLGLINKIKTYMELVELLTDNPFASSPTQ